MLDPVMSTERLTPATDSLSRCLRHAAARTGVSMVLAACVTLVEGGARISVVETSAPIGSAVVSLPACAVDIACLLTAPEEWSRPHQSTLPTVWAAELTAAGYTSVRLVPLRDSGGFKGVAVYASRGTRVRSIAQSTTDSIGGSLRESYASVEGALGNSAVVVWGPDDTVLGATEGARAWLHGGRNRFAVAAQLARTCDCPGGCLIENVIVESTPIEGTATLVMNLRPATPVPVAATASLAPRILEAAEYASFGATAAEIARTMEISVETVRGYLKSAYRALGVCNRVELARSLGSVH